AKSVARALNEQHRSFDTRQMLRPKLVRPSRRMERIAEEDETLNAGAAGSNLGRDPPAQRFAANDQFTTADFLANSLKHCPVTRLEGSVLIRDAPALLRVQEIERDRAYSARREPARKTGHEITGLIGAGAVPKSYRDINLILTGRRVDES